MPSVRFNENKNILLKQIRGINFDDVLEAIEKGGLIDDIEHPSNKYLHQHIFVVKINNYIYAVPYIEDTDENLFLKTVYPSRILTRIYLKKHGKNKTQK